MSKGTPIGRYLFVGRKEQEQPQRAEDAGRGRISNALTKQIAYEANPTLFDTLEEQERDRLLLAERKFKPLALSQLGEKIVYALSYAVSQDMENEDIKAKIADLQSNLMGGRGVAITRSLSIPDLAYFLFKSRKQYYIDAIAEELYTISTTPQVFIFETEINGKKKKFQYMGTLLKADILKDLNPEVERDLSAVNITFGKSFFFGLNNRYANLTPRLFEAWRKNGRATELYGILQSHLITIYWGFKAAADKAEARVRKSKEYKALTSQEERDRLLRGERLKHMTYEVNVDNILSRVGRDYTSKKQYWTKFRNDLQRAIEGYIEAGLIIKGELLKGVQKQWKLRFIFSDTFNSSAPEDKTPLLSEGKKSEDGEEFSAF